jgi:hypothetical protein
MMMASNMSTILVICQMVPTMNGIHPSGKKRASTTIASISNNVFGFCITDFFPNERLPSSEMHACLP